MRVPNIGQHKSRYMAFLEIHFFVKGPSADATDAPQP
jgi:hypothetical protein